MPASLVKLRAARTNTRISAAFVIAAGLVILGFIGLLDYHSGREISFGVFYFLPIWLVTWHFHLRAGIIFAVLSALVWLTVENASGVTYSSVLVLYWNGASRLVYFLTFAFLLSNLGEKLRQSRQEVKRLSSLLPICASCKKIRDEKGQWHQIESYIRDHSDTDFSHGVCSDCAKKLYPEAFDEAVKKLARSRG